MQECNTELPLELGNLTAQGRLRYIDKGGRTRNASGLDDLHEVAQLTQLNDTYLRCVAKIPHRRIQ